MKKGQKNTLILSIVFVAMIIVVISGGTYAYWRWTSSTTTAVSFTVTGGTMTINGGGNISTNKLAPAACTNTTYAIQRKIMVTASNETATAMTGTIGLNVVALTAAQGTLNSTNKANLKYALVEINATKYAATTTWDGCSTTVANGTFATYATGGQIPLLTNISIPAASGSTAGSATKYYELYIWILSTYGNNETPTSGTTITDPLQNLTLNLTWYGSMTQNS